MSGGPVGQPESARWCRKEADGWPRKPTILVVTEDPEPSEAMSAWLREAGLRVVACPGPQPPTYLCAGDGAKVARSP
jgi:hypothetical protein